MAHHDIHKNAASDGKNKRDRRAILRAHPYEAYLGCSRKLHKCFLYNSKSAPVRNFLRMLTQTPQMDFVNSKNAPVWNLFFGILKQAQGKTFVKF